MKLEDHRRLMKEYMTKLKDAFLKYNLNVDEKALKFCSKTDKAHVQKRTNQQLTDQTSQHTEQTGE